MKIDRERIEYFINTSRQGRPELSTAELADRLCTLIEANPSCINLNQPCDKGRFSYSTVGYGVFTLLRERYRMGRIEVYDAKAESGYATHEGIYTMPFKAASQFEDFIESFETDLPIHIEIGSHQWCEQECAKDLELSSVEELSSTEKIQEYTVEKNNLFAKEQGFRDWEDLVHNYSKVLPLMKEKK